MAEKKKKAGTEKSASDKPKSEKSPEKAPPSKIQIQNQQYAVVLFGIAILLFMLTLVKGNSGWLVLHEGLWGIFGITLPLVPVALCYIAFMLDRDTAPQKLVRKTVMALVFIMFTSCFLEIMLGGGRMMDTPVGELLTILREEGKQGRGGGMISIAAYPLQKIFGDVGSKILICLLLFVSIMLMTKKTLSDFLHLLTAPFRYVRDLFYEEREEEELLEQEAQQFAIDTEQGALTMSKKSRRKAEPAENRDFQIDIPMEDASAPAKPAPAAPTSKKKEKSTPPKSSAPEETSTPPAEDPNLEELIRKATRKKSKEEEKQEAVSQIADEVAQQAHQSENLAPDSPYQMPRLDFLNRGETHAQDAGAGLELREKADLLQEVLHSFNVEARITNIARGPSVTRYEVQPAAGVKVSRITSLSNDIALNFATEGVRMEAPIPGKPAIGIEVPNEKRDTVSLRELLESRQFAESRSKLAFAVGKDIAGNVIIGDIAKMPHMIIAGATGSGKSVCTNSIIMSLLYHATPDEVKLILIDPKIVEFRVYDGIPHLLIPVVTDPKKAAGALNWAVQEMLRRYDAFAENGVRNLGEFNALCRKQPELQTMPQIVICIDELAELMMTASKEVEDSVCRLAQLARAAGMHLVIATQRPTTNIITGLIKANIPSRIALSVKSQVDSRVILDMSGAETLLGNGDMLYLPGGQPKPLRVQGCYVSTEEIERVVNFIKSQTTSNYDEQIMQAVDELTISTADEDAPDSGGEEAPIDTDADLIEQAIEVVVNAGQASTSNLQRRLRLGYVHAARIMDELEEMGVIGPYEGAKPRRVLLTKTQLDERKLRHME